MAKPIRVEFEGAVYYVMAQGNERPEIFRSDQIRAMLLETLAQTENQLAKKLMVQKAIFNFQELTLCSLRSADFQSAVSQVFQPASGSWHRRAAGGGRLADYKSAARQVANLRYLGKNVAARERRERNRTPASL